MLPADPRPRPRRAAATPSRAWLRACRGRRSVRGLRPRRAAHDDDRGQQQATPATATSPWPRHGQHREHGAPPRVASSTSPSANPPCTSELGHAVTPSIATTMSPATASPERLVPCPVSIDAACRAPAEPRRPRPAARTPQRCQAPSVPRDARHRLAPPQPTTPSFDRTEVDSEQRDAARPRQDSAVEPCCCSTTSSSVSAAGEPPAPKSPLFPPSCIRHAEPGLRAAVRPLCRETVASLCLCRSAFPIPAAHPGQPQRATAGQQQACS